MSRTDRDEAVDRLLRQSLKPSPDEVTAACLDAEALAAWADGGLSGRALELAEAHVASCGRCQSLVAALARMDEPAPVESPRLARWLVWLVPTAAMASVAVGFLWMGILPDFQLPHRQSARAVAANADVELPRDLLREKAAVQPAVVPPEQAPTVPAVPQPRAEADARERRRAPQTAEAPAAKERALAEADLKSIVEPPAAAAPVPAFAPPASSAPAAAASPTSAPSSNARVLADRQASRAAAPEIVILSPTPAIRWRLVGMAIERSTDGGTAWTRVFSGSAQLVAGQAPTPQVCWVIGRGGLLLRSTDGITFARVTLPAGAEPATIAATDAANARVATSDGRTLVTRDGGANWEPRLQEF